MLKTLNIELNEFIQKYKPYLVIIAKNKVNEVVSIVGWVEGETSNYPIQINTTKNFEQILENARYSLVNVQYHDSQKILMFKR